MHRTLIALAAAFLLSVPTQSSAQDTILTGAITDAVTGAPLQNGITVSLYSPTDDNFSAGSATPDASGRYEIQRFGGGTFFVKVSTASGYVSQLHGNIPCSAVDCKPSSGTPVMLTAGTTTTVDFALVRGGGFTGTVRRASNGTPLSDVRVIVYNASTSVAKDAITAADGTYVADGLPTGTYFARTEYGTLSDPVDFVPELYGGVSCPPTQFTTQFSAAPTYDCHIASGTSITVTAGSTTPGIDFSLDPAGTISGTVVADGTSTPIADVPVVVYAGDLPLRSVPTNSSGQYAISGLPPGSYRVRTNLPQGNFVNEWHNGVCLGCPGTPGTVTVGSGTTVAGIDFSLAQGGAISGTITCQGPFTFIWMPLISVYSASGVLVRSTPDFSGICGSTQNYLVEGLPPGQYYLLARDTPANSFSIRPTGGYFVDVLYGDIVCMTVDCDVRRGVPVSVMSGVTTAGVDFSVRQGAFSSNTVSRALPLRVYDARGVELVSVLKLGRFFSGNEQEIVGLPPGTYFAKWGNILHGGLTCVECPPTSGTPIVVRPGDVSFTLNFGPVSAGQRVSGTVRNEAGAVPLSTITVELLTATGQLVGSGLTDFNGQYSIAGLQPGTYLARTRNDRGLADETFANVVCGQCDPRAGTPIVVGVADVAGIDFTLAAGGVITGLTTDTTGAVVGSVPIAVFTAGGVEAGRTLSGVHGQFRISVPAGSYRGRAEATVTHGAEVFSEQPCTSGACDVTAGTAIPATAGAITPNINFTLASCTAMTLSPPLLASGVVGRPYRQVLSVSGGTAPASFHVTEGVLPAGLALNSSSGVLDGTSTVSGRHAFTVGAVDAAGCATAKASVLDVQSCAFTLSPSSATLPAAGATVTVTISDSCGPQTVGDTATFVSVQSNTPGQVVLSIAPNTTANARSADVTIGRRVFPVRQGGLVSQAPFGSLDVPLDFAQVSGSLGLGGWALDDLEVRHVQIFRDPVGGEPPVQIFLGNAVFVAGARPDVQRAYPTYPRSDRAGWGFLILTNVLPNQGNGTFRIYAYAEDVEGIRVLLGARTIVATNATAALPFGAIDTPGQGETIAGSAYLNWGWALTPRPKIIPTDGSTIVVLVDGVPQGTVTYNLFRPDVAGLFPGLANSSGPVGYRILDTTGFAEGQHTIAWIVTDDQGATTGIGSRYFTVANSADAQPQGLRRAASSTEDAEVRSTAVESSSVANAPGPDVGRRAASLEDKPIGTSRVLAQRGTGPLHVVRETDDGARAIALKPMERLELRLSGSDAECAGTWAGYLVEKDTLRELPVGAAIDAAGMFYWQPGPGFVGMFELWFVRTGCDGAKARVPVQISIGGR